MEIGKMGKVININFSEGEFCDLNKSKILP